MNDFQNVFTDKEIEQKWRELEDVLVYDDENKWFNIEDFMEWARNEFPEPMKYHFTFDMLENIIEYVIDLVDEKDEFIEIMLRIVPEVTKKEWSEYFYKKN